MGIISWRWYRRLEATLLVIAMGAGVWYALGELERLALR